MLSVNAPRPASAAAEREPRKTDRAGQHDRIRTSTVPKTTATAAAHHDRARRRAESRASASLTIENGRDRHCGLNHSASSPPNKGQCRWYRASPRPPRLRANKEFLPHGKKHVIRRECQTANSGRFL